jgi:drug/metabolite transporter (DMT)-like permease
MFLFLFLAAVGNAIYHVGQKSVGATANPMVVLMSVYGLAFLFSALAVPFFGGTGTVASQVFSWPVLVLAAGVFLIEIGFLLAYRHGGSLQWSGAAVNGVAAILLLVVAVAVFRERVSPVRILGIVLTLSGLFLFSVH